ncbi:MAG: type II toxin-antitoxin system RelE/ParE family toxin [Proteobacteria bacterium]|nr:type II toxin-antitoxin system RelE/ParE family toxin [Pseudomonadota bacterium]
MFEIRFARSVGKDLEKLPVFYQNIIMDKIKENLSYEPSIPSKNRKILINLIPPWDAVPPIWELRVGNYRVFYDVSESEKTVYVRSILKKSGGKTTEDIL